jgi:hypothetical protein
MPYRTENWKRYGTVTVSRNAKGQFVSWKRVSLISYIPSFGKEISIYGHASNGVGRRYDFYGNGEALRRAVTLAHRIVPKRRFVRVSAREFLTHPYRYGERGYWIDREVES